MHGITFVTLLRKFPRISSSFYSSCCILFVHWPHNQNKPSDWLLKITWECRRQTPPVRHFFQVIFEKKNLVLLLLKKEL